MTHQT